MFDDWNFSDAIDPSYGDYGGMDIGINPGSSGLDFSGYNALTDDPSNLYTTNRPTDYGYTPDNRDWTFGNTSGGGLQVDQPTSVGTQTGSPNVGSPSEKDILTAGGKADDSGGVLSKIGGAAKSLVSDKSGDPDIARRWSIRLLDSVAFMQSTIRTKTEITVTGFDDGPTVAKATQLVQNKNNDWTPQQSVWANQFFQTPALSAASGQRPLVRAGEGGIKSIMPSQGYADGGKVNDDLSELIQAWKDKGGGENDSVAKPSGSFGQKLLGIAPTRCACASTWCRYRCKHGGWWTGRSFSNGSRRSSYATATRSIESW